MDSSAADLLLSLEIASCPRAQFQGQSQNQEQLPGHNVRVSPYIDISSVFLASPVVCPPSSLGTCNRRPRQPIEFARLSSIVVLLLPPLTSIHATGNAHISIHRPVHLRLISHTPPAENQEGRSQCRVSVISASKFSVNQASSDFCSNLSGLFFLLDPRSAVGFLIAQVVGQIPYVLLGSSWGLEKKHEGTDA